MIRIFSLHRSLSSLAKMNIEGIHFGTGTAKYKGYGHNFVEELDHSVVDQTLVALESGFTHLDLAEVYGNGREVREALKKYYAKSEKKREDLWITSKIWKTLSNPLEGTEAIINQMDCKYLDLLLLHVPNEFIPLMSKASDDSNSPLLPIQSLWSSMEKLVELKKVRYIGISNFRTSDIKKLLPHCKIKPYVNQVEFNPYLQQPNLQKFCENEGIRMQAYAPLAPVNLWPEGPLEKVISQLAATYNVSTSAILLAYTRMRGYIPITTTSKKSRAVEYLSSLELTLTKADVDMIDEVGGTYHKRKYFTQVFKENDRDAGLL